MVTRTTPNAVTLRIENPGAAQIRAEVLPTTPIEYGTHFILESPVGKVTAICTSGPCLYAEEPGEFLLHIDDELLRERATRHSVLDVFLSALLSP